MTGTAGKFPHIIFPSSFQKQEACAWGMIKNLLMNLSSKRLTCQLKSLSEPCLSLSQHFSLLCTVCCRLHVWVSSSDCCILCMFSIFPCSAYLLLKQRTLSVLCLILFIFRFSFLNRLLGGLESIKSKAFKKKHECSSTVSLGHEGNSLKDKSQRLCWLW